MRISSADKDKEQLDFSYIAGREFKMVSPFLENSLAVSYKVKHTYHVTQQSQLRGEDLGLHKSTVYGLSVQYLLWLYSNCQKLEITQCSLASEWLKE